MLNNIVTRKKAFCTGVRFASGREQSKAYKSLNKYLSPWAREVAQTKLESTTRKVPVPLFVPGKAGQIAMKIWQKIATTEGVTGLDRTQTELRVFLAYTKQTRKWRDLVHTPDAFVAITQKVSALTGILESLGCSPTFVSVMIPILKDGTISKLEQITTDFNEINRSYRREVDVTLITGKKLDQTSIDFYKSTIALDFLDPADNMIFSHTVDHNISGYKVMIKNKVHDFTHNNAISSSLQKHISASQHNPRDELFKDLNGVMSHEEIEKIWKKEQEKQQRS